jgi:hypothetical protein
LTFIYNHHEIDVRTLRPIIDVDGYIDVIAMVLNMSIFKTVFILIKEDDIKSRTKWKAPADRMAVETINGINYFELGSLINLDFGKEVDKTHDFIATQKNSIITGKLVPALDDKQADFYFEWNEPETI